LHFQSPTYLLDYLDLNIQRYEDKYWLVLEFFLKILWANVMILTSKTWLIKQFTFPSKCAVACLQATVISKIILEVIPQTTINKARGRVGGEGRGWTKESEVEVTAGREAEFVFLPQGFRIDDSGWILDGSG
jgi:hypothetical protein